MTGPPCLFVRPVCLLCDTNIYVQAKWKICRTKIRESSILYAKNKQRYHRKNKQNNNKKKPHTHTHIEKTTTTTTKKNKQNETKTKQKKRNSGNTQ